MMTSAVASQQLHGSVNTGNALVTAQCAGLQFTPILL